ncbi:anti-sigma factor domain-containing protein [Paenibacillus sp. WC2504]|uniref:anti-sigma factor domain-containing protein n=1 Tax=Paenibacillus sp. WC2504 TaxID=3461403 RepID=UPI00404682D6
MKEHETVDCNDLVNYLTGDCTELERAAFERHLRTCASCREELRDLQDVWQALPFEMEEVELPPDLKQQVMQSILPPAKIEAIISKKNRSYKWIYGLSAAIILGLAVGIWWSSQPKNSALSVNPGLSEPAEIMHTFQLKSVESTMPTASGTAWVLQNGDVHNVVINLQGLQETKGDTAYQVWFNRNGKRYNCGTLRVDEKGTGVLTYSIPVKGKDFQIDSFGVTLEPDPNGLQPRGKKILGTS